MELLRLRQRQLPVRGVIAADTCVDVGSHMLLKDQRVGELFVTDAAGVKRADRRLGAVDTHVRLEITLRRERTAADLAAERALSGVRAVVHLQRALAAQRSQTNRTLVRIGQFLVDAAHQLLHLARFGGLLDLHELFERVISLAVAQRRSTAAKVHRRRFKSKRMRRRWWRNRQVNSGWSWW